MKKIIIIAASFLGLSTVANAQAASSTATQQVGLALTNAIAMTFTGSGTSTGTAVSIPFSTVADYANGVASSAQGLMVQSNKNFTVTVNTNAANFSYTGSTTPSPTMPVSGVLALKVSANGTGGSIASPFSASSYSTLTSTAQNT